MAELVRRNLEAVHLDIPGTAYYDEGLDHLSAYYSRPGRAYFVLTEDGKVIGGIGFAGLESMKDTAELQKLYLTDRVKGRGTGYEMIRRIEDKARELGYKKMYLETHTNLEAAVHLYEKCGFHQIPKPDFVIHSTMNRFYLKEL